MISMVMALEIWNKGTISFLSGVVLLWFQNLHCQMGMAFRKNCNHVLLGFGFLTNAIKSRNGYKRMSQWQWWSLDGPTHARNTGSDNIWQNLDHVGHVWQNIILLCLQSEFELISLDVLQVVAEVTAVDDQLFNVFSNDVFLDAFI